MTSAFSAAVKLADLDDLLSPAQSCILSVLDNERSRRDVVSRSATSHSAAPIAYSATTVDNATVHTSVPHPPSHSRALKSARFKAKQDIAQSPGASTAETFPSSTAAFSDGAGLSSAGAVGHAAGGTASAQHVSSGNDSPSTQTRSKHQPFTEYASSAYTRPSLIKLGNSRVAKKSVKDFSTSSAAGARGSTNTGIKLPSRVAPLSSSSDVKSSSESMTTPANQDANKQVARVALYDCLACKGCVTSSEAILVERHSVDEFLRRTRAAVPSSCTMREEEDIPAFAAGNAVQDAANSLSFTEGAIDVLTAAAAANGMKMKAAGNENASKEKLENGAVFSGKNVNSADSTGRTQETDTAPPPRLVVVSISPQSLTALQRHFGMKSAAVTVRKLSSLFRLAGATHVMHTAVGDALSVLEVEREFIDRCKAAGMGRRKETNSSSKEATDGGRTAAKSPNETTQQEPLEATAAHQRKRTLSAAESSEAGSIAGGGSAAKGPGEAASGGQTVWLAARGAAAGAGVAATGAEEDSEAGAGGGNAAPKHSYAARNSSTAGRSSRRPPEKQAAAEEFTGEVLADNYNRAHTRRRCSDDICFSKMGNSSKRKGEMRGCALRGPCVFPSGLGVSDAQSVQQEDVEQQQQLPQIKQHHSSQQPQHSSEQLQHSSEQLQHSSEQPQHSTQQPQHSTQQPQRSTQQPQHSSQQPQQKQQKQEQQQQEHQQEQQRNLQQPNPQLQHQPQHEPGRQQPPLNRVEADRERSFVSSFSQKASSDNSTLPLFASFCPGFVCYAETSHDAPLLLQHMSRVRSGQQIQGILVKGLFLELHNAASFVMRLAALNAVRSDSGIDPLLLELLLRKSAYATPKCRGAASRLHKLLAGKGRAQQEATSDGQPFDGHHVFVSEIPTVGGEKLRDAGNPIDTLKRQFKQWSQRKPFIENTHRHILSFDGGCLGAEEEVRPEDIFHVCIMPCFDKKLEAARPEFKHPTFYTHAVTVPSVEALTATSTNNAADVASREEAGHWSAHAAERMYASSDLSADTRETEFPTSKLGSMIAATKGAVRTDDVSAADVDLVLATDEVPVLLQRMNVRFDELPESHVDTLLDEFLPVRSTFVPPAFVKNCTAATGGRPERRKEEASSRALVQKEHTMDAMRKTGCSSSDSGESVFSSATECQELKTPGIATNAAVRLSGSIGCVSPAVSLLPRLFQSLTRSPLNFFPQPAAAVTPYLNIPARWIWCRNCSSGSALSSEERINAETAEKHFTGAAVPLKRTAPTGLRATCSSAAHPSQERSANVVELKLHANSTESITNKSLESSEVFERLDDLQAAAASGCFISSEQMCGSGGYAERVFRRAAKELYDVNIEGPLVFQKRKKGDEGYKEAVLVVDGEEKLRVALAYGFKNIQNIVQKLKRQQRLATHDSLRPAAASARTDMIHVTLATRKLEASLSSSPVFMKQRDMLMQSTTKQRQREEEEGGKQEEHAQKQPPWVLSVPHFLEFAACPGGCLAGGGQKLAKVIEHSADRPSSAGVDAPPQPASVSSSSSSPTAPPAIKTKTPPNGSSNVEDGVKAVAKHHHGELGSEKKKVTTLDGTENRNRVFVTEEQVFLNSGRSISYSHGAHLSPPVPPPTDAAAEQEQTVRGTGHAKILETLTTLLHNSHVYCDPLQRAEVQLAYLYLLGCAEELGDKREADSEAGRRQSHHQQRLHPEVEMNQQPERRGVINHLRTLQVYTEMVQQQQAGQKKRAQKQGAPRHDLKDPQQPCEDEYEQQESRVEVMEEQCDACSNGAIRQKENNTEWADTCVGVPPYISAGGPRPARVYGSSNTAEGLTSVLSSLWSEKYVLAGHSTFLPRGMRNHGDNSDAMTKTETGTAEATHTKSAAATHPPDISHTAFVDSVSFELFNSPSLLWGAFGRNRTAVKMLRTRFRDIWGRSKEEAKQLEKGDASNSDVSSLRSTSLHRSAGATPSLHW